MVLVADKRGYLPTSFKNNAQQQNSKHWAEINSQNAPKEGLVLGEGALRIYINLATQIFRIEKDHLRLRTNRLFTEQHNSF